MIAVVFFHSAYNAHKDHAHLDTSLYEAPYDT